MRKEKEVAASSRVPVLPPVAPYIVTTDEMPEVNSVPLEISTRLNGVVKQEATTDTMTYTIPTLREFLTRTVTLQYWMWCVTVAARLRCLTDGKGTWFTAFSHRAAPRPAANLGGAR